MKHFTPGKIILSGEHAIVHGRPAIAAPLRAGITGSFSPLTTPEIRIQVPPLPSVCVPLSSLPDQLRDIDQRHEAFLADKLPVTRILPEPGGLLLAAAALAQPAAGCEIHLHSTLPIGAGLGSSAALILTVLKGLLPRATPDELYPLALRGEHFQHGRSSGLDVTVCLHRLPVFARNGGFSPLELPSGLPPFTLYHTGTPESTTGECVASVRQTHPPANPIWDRFQTVTLTLRDALIRGEPETCIRAVRENHQLLTRLGVVPHPIARAITAIEASGGAAKICGAGSVRGAAAGTVLVLASNPPPIPDTWQALDVL